MVSTTFQCMLRTRHTGEACFIIVKYCIFFSEYWSLDYIRSRIVSLVDIVGREVVSRHGRAERLYLQTELKGSDWTTACTKQKTV